MINFDSILLTLTRQQKYILDLIKEGKQNKEIAEILDISQATVGTHILRLKRKFRVGNSRQLALCLAQAEIRTLRNELLYLQTAFSEYKNHHPPISL